MPARPRLPRCGRTPGPFWSQLAVDNGEDSLFTELRELAAQFPDPDVPEVSAECRQPSSGEPAARTGGIPNSGTAGR